MTIKKLLISKTGFTNKTKDDKVVISSEFYENERPSYICSFCNQTLIRLTDAGMNNQTYWCRSCSGI